MPNEKRDKISKKKKDNHWGLGLLYDFDYQYQKKIKKKKNVQSCFVCVFKYHNEKKSDLATI